MPGDTVSLAEAPPPVRGGTIAVSDDGTQLLVVDRDRAEVHVISLSGHEVTGDRVYPFDHDARPERAVLAGDARVAILSDSRLVRLDDDGRATTIGRTCASPTGLTWDSVRSEAWVTCASGELVGMALDGTRRRAVLEPDLGDVLVHGDELWIAQVRRCGAEGRCGRSRAAVDLRAARLGPHGRVRHELAALEAMAAGLQGARTSGAIASYQRRAIAW